MSGRLAGRDVSLRHIDYLFFVVPFAATFWFVLRDLAGQWADDPNYAHRFFVVPMAAYLAWRRRAEFQATPARPSIWGAGIVAFGGLLYLAGVLALRAGRRRSCSYASRRRSPETVTTRVNGFDRTSCKYTVVFPRY